MKKFEYLEVKDVNTYAIEKTLNEYGKKGWELITLQEHRTSYPTALFKREITEFDGFWTRLKGNVK